MWYIHNWNKPLNQTKILKSSLHIETYLLGDFWHKPSHSTTCATSATVSCIQEPSLHTFKPMSQGESKKKIHIKMAWLFLTSRIFFYLSYLLVQWSALIPLLDMNNATMAVKMHDWFAQNMFSSFSQMKKSFIIVELLLCFLSELWADSAIDFRVVKCF